jgi:hypothetical protein
VTIDNGVGSRPASGSASVSPAVTTTYTLTVSGTADSTPPSGQATVTVGSPAPTATFSAAPASITTGQSSTLTWSTTNATSVSIDNGVGSKPASGTANVSPTTTTTYTLTATGAGGTITRSATVTVSAPPPSAPTITSITPSHGSAAGGNTVTIIGTNLASATSVTFGGTAAQVSNNTSTTITAVAPAHVPGTVIVTVTTSAGSGGNFYVYDAAAPTISGITPSHGPAGGGTTVTITGSNLAGVTNVTFGGASAQISNANDTALTVVAPAHAAGGVSVSVTTTGGTATASYTYDLDSQLLPVVGSTAGSFGSFFRTALQLHNPTAVAMGGRLIFHPQGVAPSPSDPSLTYTLTPHQTRFYADILPALGASGLGSLDLQPSTGSGTPLALVRIFNDANDLGTTGMAIDFVPQSQVLGFGDTAVLIAPASTAGFRFNIGVRALSNGATMLVTVRNAAGQVVRSLPQTFAADSFTQVAASAIAGDLNANDSVSFAISSGSAMIYGSTTDNTTQDPSYQSAQRVPVLTSATAVIPAAGSLAGGFGSFFRTSLQLHNPLSNTLRVRIVYHPQGQNGSASDPSSDVSLAPGQTKYFADVLATLNQSGLGSLDLVPLDGALPVTVARIYNDAGALGTTGMTLDALPPSAALQAGDNGVLITPANVTSFRYNLGVRTLAGGASVLYTVIDANGTTRASVPATYGPNFFSQRSASDVLGLTLQPNDTILIQVNSGSLVVYGAMTDNKTQDPTTQIAKKF